MKIEIASLRLVGCGPFDDVTLDFCDTNGKPKKTVLLAGANGSGKTTVLEAIVKTVWINLSPQDRTNHPNGWARLNLKLDGEHSVVLDFRSRPEEIELPAEPEQFGREFLGLMRAGLVDEKREDYPPCVLYFPHPRQLHAVDGQALSKEEFPYTPVYRHTDSDAFPGSLSSYLIWLEYSEPEEYAATIQFLNGLDVNDKKFGILRKKLQAIVTTPEGATHPVEGLSSGEQNLFILLLELRRRLTRGSIVLIDEVEGSLHPAYQYKLIYALQKLQEEFDLQLILTTHSDDILKAVGPGNTLILTDFEEVLKET